MSEPVWVRLDVALALHNEQLIQHGGAGGIRDHGLLESALARPQNLFAYSNPEPSLGQIAAAYAKGIVANHPFVDGNKRTAFVVALTFLRLNGFGLIATQADRYQIFLGLAAGEITEDQLAAWFERVAKPR